MTQPDLKVLKVVAVIDSEQVFVRELMAGDDVAGVLGARDRLVRSVDMAKAGTNSVWAVYGEPDSAEESAQFENDIPLITSQSVSFAKAPRPLRRLQLPEAYIFKAKAPLRKVRTYRHERRLKLGLYVPSSTPIEWIFSQGIPVEHSYEIDAVLFNEDQWFLRNTFEITAGALKMRPGVFRGAVEVNRLPTYPPTLPVTPFIFAFLDDPQFESLGEQDFRTAEEVSAAVDRWLQRISQSVRSTVQDRSRIEDLRAVLHNYMDETADAADLQELSAVMRAMESRKEIIELIPEIIRNDRVWSELILEQIDRQVTAKTSEMEAALSDEMIAREQELAEIQGAIAAANAELEILGQKKRAYEEAIVDIDRSIDAAVNSRLANLGVENYADAKELAALAGRLASLEAAAHHQDSSGYQAIAPSDIRMMTAQERNDSVAALSKTTGVSLSDLAMLLSSRTTGRLPVLAGNSANEAASRILYGLTVSPPLILFCDPTLVSIQDLYNATGVDGENTLKSAIAVAKASPDVLFPVGLLALTKSPVEYWLPALLAGQMVGQLPSNLLFIGSAEADGNRIGVPNSMLDRLLPITADARVLASPKAASAHWPSGITADAPEDFVSALMDLGLESSRLREFTRQASALAGLIECDVATFKAGIGTQLEWLTTISADGGKSHPKIRFFEAAEA